MNRKIIHLLLASTLFLVITLATTLLGNPVMWSGETRLTSYSGWDIGPSIVQMKDGRIWVVWQSNRIGTWNFDIFYTIYNWSSWSDPMRLTTNSSHDESASIMQTDDGTIWVVWQSIRTGNYELFYKTSSDNGVTWSNATPLTESPGYDWAPSIIQARDGTIWVVWQYYNGTDWEIFYKTYNGSWSNATQLTEDSRDDYNPSIMQARDGTIWVFWSRELWRGGQEPYQDDLFYKISVDNGATWSEDIQFTTDEVWDEESPSAVQVSDKTIWIMWKSNKNDNFDIYYSISNEIVFHDVAVTNVTASLASVYQGNPLTINVEVKNKGDFSETFNVTLYANSTEISTQMVTDLTSGDSTTLTFNWDTTSATAGDYTLSAVADSVPNETVTVDNTLVDGSVQIRIPGDIDNDGDVDSDDFYVFSGAYGTTVGEPAYDPEADINIDGEVDSDDFYLFSGNYGKSV